MAALSNPGMGPDSEAPANRTSRFRPQTSLAEELARAQSFTGANGATLASLEGDTLVWLGGVGEHQPRKGDRWSLAGSFATLCLGRKTRPQRCDDVEADGRMDQAFKGLHAKSMALAPVHDADKVTGLLAVFSDNPKAFNGMHVAVLQTQADSMAEMLQIARQAAGLQEEAKKHEEEASKPAVAGPPAPQPAEPAAAPQEPEFAVAAAPIPAEFAVTPTPVPKQQDDFSAFESSFEVVPPPVAAAPSAPPAEAVPPVVQASLPAAAPEAIHAPATSPLPKLRVVPTPAPSASQAATSEHPTLPGFMPLSATAAALAKAKPAPPTPPEMVVETKTPKAAPVPRKTEEKKAKQPVAAAPAFPVPTPPPAAAPAPRASGKPAQPPAPAARPAAPARKPTEPAAVKFVPLAKAADVKTPPPGGLKPPVAPAAGAKSAAPAKNEEDQPLPAAADPFAEFSPAFVRAQARAHAATASTATNRTTTLTGIEAVASPEPAGTGMRRTPLMVVAAALVLVVAGGLWLRVRSHAAPSKPAPVIAQPAPAQAPAPAPATEVAGAAPAPTNPATAAPATVTASVVPAAAPAGKPAAVAEKPAPAPDKAADKAAPQPKAQPETAAPKPAAAVAAPANAEVKNPTQLSVPVSTAALQPPPKTNLDISVSGADKMPDLPKPAPAVTVRQASTPVPAQLLKSVPPVYPAAAKAMRMQSTVRLSATVDTQGHVTKVNWVSGNSFFKDSAISAVKQWRYKAATLDGQAVESTVDIVLKFSPQ